MRSHAQCYGWALAGEHAELKDVIVCGDWYFLLAAVTTEGYIVVHVMEGSFDLFELYNFVTEQIVHFSCQNPLIPL